MWREAGIFVLLVTIAFSSAYLASIWLEGPPQPGAQLHWWVRTGFWAMVGVCAAYEGRPR